jgi:imidazolonepropionase-like amidohydrolase
MRNRRFLSATAGAGALRIAGVVAIVALVAIAAAPPVLDAQIGLQRERHAPSVYAITNARIVTVAGPVIERGTVVVRNGVIAAVGPSVAAPGDARVIDGTGLTVYPGLVDPNSSIGLGAAASPDNSGGRGPAGRGGRGAPAASHQGVAMSAPNSLRPAGLQPELAAIDFVRDDADAFTGPQSAGITTALTAPSTGIFRGEAAVVNLGGANAQAMLLNARAAQVIGFTPRPDGGYPNSLMGVFAVLRQSLLDAQHYVAESAAYARSPRTMRRPDLDPSLEALQRVLARQMPVILEASSQREIERALDLAREFNLRAIIAGGEEADKVATRLKAERVPVLASLNFPRRPQPSPDADPEPLRMLRARIDAPRLASKLQTAGVKFAFEDGGVATWADFLTNAKSAVDGGLGAEQAVRALTLSPAEILGVEDKVGSIEVGKIANLTITRGDLFGGRVIQVFVDGLPAEVRAPSTANGSTLIANGTWQITVTLDEGEKPMTLSLQQVGDQLRGTVQGALGSSQIADGSVSPGGEVQFRTTVTMNDGTEEARFQGSIEANVIRGTVRIVGHPQGTFVGTKPAGQNSGRRGNPPPR